MDAPTTDTLSPATDSARESPGTSLTCLDTCVETCTDACVVTASDLRRGEIAATPPAPVARVIDLVDADERLETARRRYRKAALRFHELHDELLACVPDAAFDAGHGLVSIVLDDASPLAEIHRGIEWREGWYEEPRYLAGHESSSLFVVIAERRDDGTRLVTHSTRFLRGALAPQRSSGSRVLDGVAALVDPASVAGELGVSLRRCWDLAGMITVERRSGSHTPHAAHLPYAGLSYRANAELCLANGVDVIFCVANPLTRRSIGAMGIEFRHPLGRPTSPYEVDAIEYHRRSLVGAVPIPQVVAATTNPAFAVGSAGAAVRDQPLAYVHLSGDVALPAQHAVFAAASTAAAR